MWRLKKWFLLTAADFKNGRGSKMENGHCKEVIYFSADELFGVSSALAFRPKNDPKMGSFLGGLFIEFFVDTQRF